MIYSRLFISMMLLGCCFGCQPESGPQRYDISGHITFQGKPVPYGRIVFQPDGSQGNSGPQGYAVLEDGSYHTTHGGKGAVAGAQTVIIDGFDGISTSDDAPYGAMLFPTYRTTVTIEANATNMDFQVETKAK